MSVVAEELDPFEARIAAGASGLLREFNRAGVLSAADVHVAPPPAPRHVGRTWVELDAGHFPIRTELLERPSRAAAGVEDARARRQRQPVELRADDAASPAVPPMAVVELQHRVHQAFVHRSNPRKLSASIRRRSGGRPTGTRLLRRPGGRAGEPAGGRAGG